MRKSPEDIAADKLLKRFEQRDKFKKIAVKASGFAAFLSDKKEEDILYEDLKYTELPITLLKLEELYNFYKKKSDYNDNIRNIYNEISYILESLDLIDKNPTLIMLREMKHRTEFIKNKYGIE